MPYSSLPVLPPRWGGDVPGVDLIASLLDVQLFTFNLACLWCHPGWIRVTFRNASQAKTAVGNIHHLSACARPWVFPDYNKTDTNIKLRCSFQASPHQYNSLLWSTKSRRYQRKKTLPNVNVNNWISKTTVYPSFTKENHLSRLEMTPQSSVCNL